ncbi:hypothetical protein RRG08_011971 [Elysia crispata]|uniref:Uncharacterized protein n=1 Tax=Elysia crispata TaxID=231223 RepID=A0AAE0ZH02_9GAST|nr:hypothetical protein RRG08_011971 [Elysia crispata]
MLQCLTNAELPFIRQSASANSRPSLEMFKASQLPLQVEMLAFESLESGHILLLHILLFFESSKQTLASPYDGDTILESIPTIMRQVRLPFSKPFNHELKIQAPGVAHIAFFKWLIDGS